MADEYWPLKVTAAKSSGERDDEATTFFKVAQTPPTTSILTHVLRTQVPRGYLGFVSNQQFVDAANYAFAARASDWLHTWHYLPEVEPTSKRVLRCTTLTLTQALTLTLPP